MVETHPRRGILVLLIVFRRWRHLFTFFGSLLVAGILGLLVYLLVRRAPVRRHHHRRLDGYAAPSFPIRTLAAGLIGFTYSMVVPGRPREWAGRRVRHRAVRRSRPAPATELLLVAATLESAEHGGWTTDRRTGATMLAAHHPQWASTARQAVDWCAHPDRATADHVHRLLDLGD